MTSLALHNLTSRAHFYMDITIEAPILRHCNNFTIYTILQRNIFGGYDYYSVAPETNTSLISQYNH